MRRSAISTLIFVLIIAGGVIVSVRKNPPKTRVTPPPPESASVSAPAATDGSPASETVPAASSLSEAEALERTVRTIAETSRSERNAEQLVQLLSSSGQEPILAKDKNPYTGEMTVIRTKNPLPGTRYFYAQFFSDEKGGSFPQHVSVEFRAGPHAFSDVVGALRRTMPELGDPSVTKEGFMRWELKDGYAAWVKQLGPEDVEEDGLNPHTAEDVGTIWLAIELAPHEDSGTH